MREQEVCFLDMDGKAMRLALYSLGRKARTEKELYEYLEKKEIDAREISDVIIKLREYGYLDDAAYAAEYIEGRLRKGGRRKLQFELKKKGVSDDVIRRALESIETEEEIASAIPYAVKALRGEKDWPARGRAYAALQRRGYTGQSIRAAIDKAIAAAGETDG